MGVKYIEDINDEEMDKWIKALRSGYFRQSQGAMYKATEQGFCCLGVLEAVNGATPIEGDGILTNGKVQYWLPSVETVGLLNLPEEYIERSIGVTASICVKADQENRKEKYEMKNNGTISVTVLNDALGLDFNQIADRLEETFLRKEA